MMNTIWKIASIGVVTGIAVSIASVTMADNRPGNERMGGPRGPMIEFSQLDANGDGQITEDDLTARAAERFQAADADGNGTVTLEELTTAMTARINERFDANTADDAPEKPSDIQIAAQAERMAERMMDRSDANDNGTLESTEMQPDDGFGRMIDRFDTDDDNAVSEAEFDAAKEHMDARMESRGERGEHGQRGDHGDKGRDRW